MGNLWHHLQKEKDMRSNDNEVSVFSLGVFEKLSLLEDLYGKEELLYAFVEYLEKEEPQVLKDILNENLHVAFNQGDLE